MFHRLRRPEDGGWLTKLLARRNRNIAAVALANKNARIVWALLAHQREYRASSLLQRRKDLIGITSSSCSGR